MRKLNSTAEVTKFVTDNQNPNYPTEPSDKFLINLNSVRKFKETGCDTNFDDNCLEGYISKNEDGATFTYDFPKNSCVDYITAQLVKESFVASNRDYTEVIRKKNDLS